MKAGEHREDKEGECFVQFGHGGGLTPSGITVKVRTCERMRFEKYKMFYKTTLHKILLFLQNILSSTYSMHYI
jgi:hypothetical protein